MIQINLKKLRIIVFIVALALFFIEDTFLALNNFRPQHTVIGLKLYGKGISGLNAAQLDQFLQKLQSSSPQPFKLKAGEQTFEIKKSDVNPTFNRKQVIDVLLKEGKRGNLFQRIADQNKIFFGFGSKKIKATLSKPSLTSVIQHIALGVNKDPTPPMPDFTHDLGKTIPAQPGIKVDANRLARIIAFNILNPPRQPIAIPFRKVQSQHQESELDSIRKEIPDLVAEPIQISSADQIFTLTRDDLLSMLTVVERPNPKNSKQLILVLRISDEKLNQKLGEFAKKVEGTTNAEFDDHDARIAIYSQFHSGTRSLIKIPTGAGTIAQYQQTPSLPRNLLLASMASAYNALVDQTNNEKEKFVYLTFDDGPNNIYHPAILDILKKYNVKATFFLVGQNSQRYDQITKRTIDEGHAIGNHSLTHAFLPKLSQAEIFNEISTTKNILESFANNTIDLFRPPYGGTNQNVKTDAKNLNLKLKLWDVDPRDWSEPSTDQLIDRVVSQVHSGSNILLHSNHLSTVKALPQIIEKLQLQGYAFKILE